MEEKDIIQLFKTVAQNLPFYPFIKKGIEDDAAVLKFENIYLLWTTDLFIENTHFRWEWMSPFALAYKALAVNISDIAAMGGKPLCFTISIGFPKEFSKNKLQEFLQSLKKTAQEYKLALIGGDTVESEKTVINISLLGTAPKGQIIFRSKAKVGDIICVSNYLGNAAAGLALLERGYNVKDTIFSPLINAQLFPKPEVSLGQYLAQTGLAHAMIDVSDGIASDLTWICLESRVGAEIYQEKLPISPLCKEAAKRLKINILQWVLSGGEDYCLLFTVPASEVEGLKKDIQKKFKKDIFIIGEITKRNKVYLISNGQKEDISQKGFSHFKDKRVCKN